MTPEIFEFILVAIVIIVESAKEFLILDPSEVFFYLWIIISNILFLPVLLIEILMQIGTVIISYVP